MKGNYDTQEAEQVRRRSEFLKNVEDFARYMHKEYIEEDDGDRALMISAVDRNPDVGTEGGVAHFAIGDRALTAAMMATAMRHEDLNDVFRMARVLSSDNDDIHGSIEIMRRHLRRLYAYEAVAVLWGLFVVGLWIWGVLDAVTTVSSLLLTLFLLYLLRTEADRRRRQKAGLEDSAREDFKAREANKIAEAVQEMKRRAWLWRLLERGHDDEEDDEE